MSSLHAQHGEPLAPSAASSSDGAALDNAPIDTAPVQAPNAATPQLSAPRPSSSNASSGRLARNTLFSYIATFAGTVLGFFVTPYLLSHLGAEYFGLWILLLSVVSYMGLLEIGLYTTISKRVAECLAVDDQPRLQCVLSTALLMYGVLSVLVLGIGLILVSLVDRIFHLPPGSAHIARGCLFLLTLNQMMVFGFRLQPALLFGAGRMDLLTGVATVINISTAVGNISLAAAGYNIIALAAFTLLTTTAGGLVGRHLIKRHLPPVLIHARHANREMARELLKFGSRNATLSIAGAIAFGADALVIGLLLPLSNVALYTIAAKLANLLKELCQKPVDVLMPAYSHSEAHGDVARHFKLWSESISLSMIIALPFVIAACSFGERLVTAWVGIGQESSGAIFAVLALMQFLQLPGHASSALLTGTERNLLMVRIYIISAIVNLALSFTLTRVLGPIGVALGSLIVVAVVDFVLLPIVVCRQFEFRFGAYLAQSLLPLALPVFTATLVVWGALAWHTKYFVAPPNRLETVALLMLMCLACWTTWLVAGIGATRRGSYLRSLRSALGR